MRGQLQYAGRSLERRFAGAHTKSASCNIRNAALAATQLHEQLLVTTTSITMKNTPTNRSLSPLLFGLLMWGLAARVASAPTLEQLVAQNIEARGGAAALAAMKSLKIQGKLLIQDGQFELLYVQTVRRPSSIRTEATIQGLTQVQTFDGTTGWQINPFQGRKDPERLSKIGRASCRERV